MVQDDGDIVRGLGFVSMYAAWVEEDVDDLLRLMEPIEPFDERTQRWSISRKLNHAARIIRRLNSPELTDLPEALEVGVDLFERRNEVLHGRIYASIADKTDYLQSGRRNTPTRPILSAALYQLANDFFNYRRNLIGPQFFRLPHAIGKVLNDATDQKEMMNA
jgi:hypothetical protein